MEIKKLQSKAFVDLLKGTAVFFVLWGHTIQYCCLGSFDFFENGVFKFIYSFHMPFFMLISGYLFWFSYQKRNFKDLIKHRTQSLLQPIIIYFIFNYLFTSVIFSFLTEGRDGILSVLFSGEMFNASLGWLWFLCSVLASSLIVATVCTITKNEILRIIFCVLGWVVVMMFPNKGLNCYVYPYFVIGFYFAKHKDQIPVKILRLKYLSLFIFPILLCFFKKEHYIYTSGIHLSINLEFLSIDCFRWGIGLLGSIFIITILQIFFDVFTTKWHYLRIMQAFEKIGGKSLQMYCLQHTFLEVWLPTVLGYVTRHFIGYNILCNNMILYDCVITPLVAICYVVGLMLVIKLLEKIKISRIIFGR